MKKTQVYIVFFVVFSILVSNLALACAHAPLETQDNESIANATVIPDPTKSWAIYSALNNDRDAQYYTFDINADQTIRVLMFKSLRTEDTNFNPLLILMGQNLNNTGEIPSQIEVPEKYIAQIIHPTLPQPSYEPFSPGTLAYVTELTINDVPAGKYYLVVYEASANPTGGHYGLAIGQRETYTIDEWIFLPFNLVNIYQWEGQSLALILTPTIASLIVGIIFLFWILRRQHNLAKPMGWLGGLAGFSFIGTSASTFMQLMIAATQVSIGGEVVITLIFAITQLALGLVTIRAALRNSDRITFKNRIFLLILGISGLFIWSGFIVGPVLAIGAVFMPTSVRGKVKKEKEIEARIRA